MNFAPLIDWYEAHARPLAFRQDKDPYKIWVSEIMAQQTRIEAMLDKYETFIRQYPTIQDLADADEESLHKAWQGLGYYSRARNLHKTALLCKETGLPKTKAELEKLPGIGPYTAGAIASICHEEAVSAVDGNVLRVFARLYDIQEDVMQPAQKKQIETLVLDGMAGKPSQYNQALMELGALVCIPKHPKCGNCPMQSQCQADHPENLPVRPAKKAKQEEDVNVYVWTDGKGILLKKRGPGLLAGMYGFENHLPDHILRIVPLDFHRHVFTHRIWNMTGWLVLTDEKADYKNEQEAGKLGIASAYLPFYNQAWKLLEEWNGNGD
jgi:A/G-specific adenine glycosylase